MTRIVQAVVVGSLVLTATSASAQRSGPWFHFGNESTFLGINAGNLTMTGDRNTGVGQDALSSNTGGRQNTAVGNWALADNTDGLANTALGIAALSRNTTADLNTAVGGSALRTHTAGFGNTAVGGGAMIFKTTGDFNTAVGALTLGSINNVETTGDNNIAVGYRAGANLMTGSDNIYIGHEGAETESGTTRIGDGDQTRTFISAIRGVTTDTADAIAVYVDSSGQLGTVSSSRRYKEDILDMGVASAGLLQLRPVTFRYTEPFAGGSKPMQYGLIAEEVAEVYPELVVYNEQGEAETIQYRKVNAMLLNEVQKLSDQVRDLTDRLAALEGQPAAVAPTTKGISRPD